MWCKQRQWDVNKRQWDVDKDNEMWTKTMRCKQRQWDIYKDNEMWTKTMRCELFVYISLSLFTSHCKDIEM